MELPSLLSCLHSLRWMILYLFHFLENIFINLLIQVLQNNTSIMIHNIENYSMLESNEVPCLTSSQETFLHYVMKTIINN